MAAGGAVALGLVVVGVLCSVEHVVCTRCPWDEPGLLKWSDVSTWTTGVPRPNEEVKIPNGSRVLLDTQPATLRSLTIEEGAALIWGNVDRLVLSTRYILIKGEFHIGSEECKFGNTSTIRLLGSSRSGQSVHMFGRKFIGVAPGGTLELHGKSKTSWTKLAQTVRRPSELDCGFVYDHETSQVGREGTKGVSVIIWNTDGSVMDYKIQSSKDNFTGFFNTVPDGKIIGIYSTSALTRDIKNTVAGFGGSVIVNYKKVEFYAFIGKKGNLTSVQEILISSRPNSRRKAFVASSGYLSLHDADNKLVFQVSKVPTRQYFRVLDESVAHPVITLANEVNGWGPGDRIVITSTDTNWRQAEVKEIIKCDGCSNRQIRVNDTFDYLHFGNFTFNVDERAEVAMLTRNILIEGVMSDKCSTTSKEEREACKRFKMDTFGGHLKVLKDHKSVHIEGVELVHMGQQAKLGSYPLHCHMCDNVKGMYLRQNSIHDSFSRCITVHGTHDLQVLDNVCYKHFGHGLFLEDAVEQNNTIRGNLVVGTMFGTLLMSDSKGEWCPKALSEHCGDLSSYWLTHPNNIVEGNVAGGGEGHGFTYMFADRPLGPSRKRQEELNITHDPRVFPLIFNRNSAHSYRLDGVFADGKISDGSTVKENAVLRGLFSYYPKIDGKPIFANMTYVQSFKNGKVCVWIKGGNIRLTHSTVADCREGFAGGTSLMNSGSILYKSYFVGETENKGYERPPIREHTVNNAVKHYTSSVTGVTIYQGPVIIDNCFFDKFDTKSWCLNQSVPLAACSSQDLVTRYAAGISFKKKSNYPFMSSSFANNNNFGYCDDQTHHWLFQGDDGQGDFRWRDGNTMVYLADKDGRLTGTQNTAVVNDIPLYVGPDCQKRPQWGKLAVCPYRYIKMKIKGTEGSLDNGLQKKYPLTIWRTDSPYNETFSMNADVRIEYLLRTNRSYIIDLNDTLAGAGFSRTYTFFGFGVETLDEVRIGLCQPLDVESYGVVMTYPSVIRDNATWAKNLAELDADRSGHMLFHDKENGILFFKIMSFHDDNNATQQCPQGLCWKIHLKVNGGNLTKVRSCRKHLERLGRRVDDFVDVRRNKKLRKTVKAPRRCRPKSVPERPNYTWNQGYIVHTEFSPVCRSLKSQQGQHEGCFEKKLNRTMSQELHYEILKLRKSMTPGFCVNRCYHRGYQYAALTKGHTCTCGHKLMGPGVGFKKDAAMCTHKCKGDRKLTCGGKTFLDVWNTGN